MGWGAWAGPYGLVHVGWGAWAGVHGLVLVGWDVWFKGLEVKGLRPWQASSLFHILKDPDFSLLFPLLTQRLQVPLWIYTRVGWGVLVLAVGAGDLCIPAY